MLYISARRFYHDVGYIRIGTKDGKYLTNSSRNAVEARVPFKPLSRKDLDDLLPYFSFHPDDNGIYVRDAGYINPREMIAAQQKLAS